MINGIEVMAMKINLLWFYCIFILFITFTISYGDPNQNTVPAEQQAQIKTMLSKYNPSSLTVEDAKAIHRALRDAGVRGGREADTILSQFGFDPTEMSRLDPPPDKKTMNNRKESIPQPVGNKYTIEQAISDKAQLNTIAFDALTFFTGGMGCNTFLPPGKVSDFFGFQHLRDVDQGEMGHSTSFLPKAANNMLYVLNSEQKQQLILLGKEQENAIREFAMKRFPLIKAFYQQLSGDIPHRSKGLDRKAVIDYSADLYKLDGILAYRRAEVMGSYS